MVQTSTCRICVVQAPLHAHLSGFLKVVHLGLRQDVRPLHRPQNPIYHCCRKVKIPNQLEDHGDLVVATPLLSTMAFLVMHGRGHEVLVCKTQSELTMFECIY